MNDADTLKLLEFIRSCTDEEVTVTYDEDQSFEPGHAIGCSTLSPKDRGKYEHSIFHAMPDGFKTPYSEEKAVMGDLIAKGLCEGCLCGCKGEFMVTHKGRVAIKNLRNTITDRL